LLRGRSKDAMRPGLCVTGVAGVAGVTDVAAVIGLGLTNVAVDLDGIRRARENSEGEGDNVVDGMVVAGLTFSSARRTDRSFDEREGAGVDEEEVWAVALETDDMGLF
jgi:hypothetical protein